MIDLMKIWIFLLKNAVQSLAESFKTFSKSISTALNRLKHFLSKNSLHVLVLRWLHEDQLIAKLFKDDISQIFKDFM